MPGVLVAILILLAQHEASALGDKHDPNFQYGSAQAVVALLVLWLSLFTTMVSGRLGMKGWDFCVTCVSLNDDVSHLATMRLSLCLLCLVCLLVG